MKRLTRITFYDKARVRTPYAVQSYLNTYDIGKLDWVASIPVRVGHEDKSSSGPARRDEDLFKITYFRPYRLSVRTFGFRPKKSGSTPGGATAMFDNYADLMKVVDNSERRMVW